MDISPLAGKPAPESILANIPRLVTEYYALEPDPAAPQQRVAFGTSGHRGTSLRCSFNEEHIIAITQAICIHRRQQGIDGPLFIAIDTHALSEPEFIAAGLNDVRRISYARAKSAATTHRYDYMKTYIGDLRSVIDFEAIRGANVKLGVDPLGGAGVFYWGMIADRYRLPLTLVSQVVD